MKPLWLTLLALALAQAATLAAQEPRAEIALNGTWQAAEVAGASEAPPAEGWRDFPVPGVLWSTAEGGSRFVWLRRDVTVPADWAGRRVFLVLMGARYDPHAYMDGRPIASRLEGYTPFEVEVTESVRPGMTHGLAIRCQDWGATFADGYQLPPGEWGDGKPHAKVLAPIGGHHGFFGPWDDVLLVTRRKLYLRDHMVAPSVRQGRLTIRGSLSGAVTDARVEAQVLDGEEPVLAMPPVLSGPDGRWQISSPFANAQCWSPEDPHLYTLRLTLRDRADGPVVDRLEQQFGFKEFWIEGPDFYLNGVRRHLLATSCWPTPQPQSCEEVRRALQYWKAANCVAFRCHTQPWRKAWVEEADRLGMMLIMEAAIWTDSGRYAYKDERFWNNYREHLARMVQRDRNNASLVMWSLENELLSVGNERFDPELPQKLAALGRFVKELDPYHPITYESDLDPGGAADVIGLHYPHELPDHSDYPNTCDWLEARRRLDAGGGLLGTQSRDFVWTRNKPLYIGEYLWVPTQDHSPASVFFGDAAYLNKDEYNARAKALAWFDQTVAYRRAGVSGLCPWALGFPYGERPEESPFFIQQKRAYEPVAAFLRDSDTRFFAGETVTRTFDILNDSPTEQQLELRWELNGTALRGAHPLALPPGGYQAVEVTLNLPQVSDGTEYTFDATLLASGKVMHRQMASCSVVPRAALRTPEGVNVIVYGPKQQWAQRLEAAGLQGRHITALSELRNADPASDILVIAPGALKAAATQSRLPVVGREIEGSYQLAAFLRDGGRALVLEQDSFAGLPLPVSLVEHASTMTFALNARHAVLEGIQPEDLKFWRGDHHVTRREVRRPTSHGARAITVSGGDSALDQAPIVGLHAGQGTVLLMQALVGEKMDSEPAARRILQNAFDYLASMRPARQLNVLLAADSAFTGALLRLGLDILVAGGVAIPTDMEQWGLVILHGGGDAVTGLTDHLKAFVEAGGTVYWHAPKPDAFAAVAEALALRNVAIGAAQGPVTFLQADHPLLAGASREDLYFTGPFKSWMRDSELDTTVVDRAVVPAVADQDSQRLEAEKMEVEGFIVPVLEDRVRFATQGTASAWVEASEAGLHVLTVLAAGTPAGGVWPLASVRMNGREAAALSIASREMRPYPVLAELPAGRSRLSVSFVNDQVIGNEDRNLTLDAVLVSRKPWAVGDLQVLTQPAALAVLRAGKGQIVLDGVRWDTNEGNRQKGYRYASALLANLGAAFAGARPEPDRVPAQAFEPVGHIAYFSKDEREFGIYSPGAMQGRFACARRGQYAVLLSGRSSPAGGIFARAEVSLDGSALKEISVASAQESTFEVAEVALSEGEHVVTARFTNDGQVGPEDRNLWIRAIGLRRED